MKMKNWLSLQEIDHYLLFEKLVKPLPPRICLMLSWSSSISKAQLDALNKSRILAQSNPIEWWDTKKTSIIPKHQVTLCLLNLSSNIWARVATIVIATIITRIIAIQLTTKLWQMQVPLYKKSKRTYSNFTMVQIAWIPINGQHSCISPLIDPVILVL